MQIGTSSPSFLQSRQLVSRWIINFIRHFPPAVAKSKEAVGHFPVSFPVYQTWMGPACQTEKDFAYQSAMGSVCPIAREHAWTILPLSGPRVACRERIAYPSAMA